MNNAIRWAGVCATGAFTLIVYIGFFNKVPPLTSLIMGVTWGLGLGIIGFNIGRILDRPAGPPPGKKKKGKKASKKASPTATGNETYLDDIG